MSDSNMTFEAVSAFVTKFCDLTTCVLPMNVCLLFPHQKAWDQRLSGHQDREARLAQDRPRDATEHPLA
jgi:hypothetical protein